MSEKGTSVEFLLGIEDYLRYLGNENYADRLHTFSRTINSESKEEDSIRAFLQDFSSILQSDYRNYADLLHGFCKNSNPTAIKRIVLHFFGKILNNQSVNDLIHGILKAESNDTVYKVILQYISKNIDDTDQLDFIHGVIKYTDLLDFYKTLLQFIGKVFENKFPESDLSLSIKRALTGDEFEQAFIQSYFSMLDRKFSNDKIFRGINNLIKNKINLQVINDAFSRGQVKSKIWLIEELAKIKLDYSNVVILAGWFGQIKSIYDKKLAYSKMRIVELDKAACETSDYVFNLSNLENYKVKSVLADINNLVLHKNGYEWEVKNFKDNSGFLEKFTPNLIINTSAEHMTEEWYNQIRFKNLESDPIVAIQSNNMFEVKEHINCVHSVDHMKKKFPMKEVLYEGELQLKGYKRVMIIGRP